MPIYQFRCDCGRREEVFEHSYKNMRAPVCCERDMDRDFNAEHFGGITQREKGTAYARGFVETFENNGRSEKVFIKSLTHHRQELDRRGLTWKGPQKAEAVYRRKHAMDRVRTAEREQRGSG